MKQKRKWMTQTAWTLGNDDLIEMGGPWKIEGTNFKGTYFFRRNKFWCNKKERWKVTPKCVEGRRENVEMSQTLLGVVKWLEHSIYRVENRYKKWMTQIAWTLGNDDLIEKDKPWKLPFLCDFLYIQEINDQLSISLPIGKIWLCQFIID